MAILKMIEIAGGNTHRVETSSRFTDWQRKCSRVGEFIKRFDKVKKDIDVLSKDYDDAYNMREKEIQVIASLAFNLSNTTNSV